MVNWPSFLRSGAAQELKVNVKQLNSGGGNLQSVTNLVVDLQSSHQGRLSLRNTPRALKVTIVNGCLTQLLDGHRVAELVLRNVVFDSTEALTSLTTIRSLQLREGSKVYFACCSQTLRRLEIHDSDDIPRLDFDPITGPWKVLTHVVIHSAPLRLCRLHDSYGLSSLRHVSLINVGMTNLVQASVLMACKNLSVLDVSQNQLTSLQYANEIGPKLLQLIATDNDIETLGSVHLLGHIQRLDLGRNDLKDWCEVGDIARYCTCLRSLSLVNNPMMNIGAPTEMKLFAAALFEFNGKLQIDGENAKNAKSSVNVKFIERHSGLLSRRMAAPTETRTLEDEISFFDASTSREASMMRPWDGDAQESARRPATGRPSMRRVITKKKLMGDNSTTVASVSETGKRVVKRTSTRRLLGGDASPPASPHPLPPSAGSSGSMRALRRRGCPNAGADEADRPLPPAPALLPPPKLTPLFMQFLSFIHDAKWPASMAVRGGNGVATMRTTVAGMPREGLGYILWEHSDDLDVPQNSFEAYLHDPAAGADKVNSDKRYEDVELMRLIEIPVGTALAYRLEWRHFQGRPVFTTIVPTEAEGLVHSVDVRVVEGAEDARQAATQRTNAVEEYLGEQRSSSTNLNVTGGVSPRRSGSLISLPVNATEARAAKMAAIRDMFLAVGRPKLVGGFVIPKGPAVQVFLDRVKQHFAHCNSQWTTLGIRQRWPLHFPATCVRAADAGDITFPSSQMTQAELRIRMNRASADEMDRQRWGVKLCVPQEDIDMHIGAHVFGARDMAKNITLANNPNPPKESLYCVAYANLIRFPSESPSSPPDNEIAVLVVITSKAIILARDLNFAESGVTTASGLFPYMLDFPAHCITNVECHYNLHYFRVDVEGEKSMIICTREPSVTLCILNALVTAGVPPTLLCVIPCLYPEITSKDELFSVSVFMRPFDRTGSVPMTRSSASAESFPLRHTWDAMVPVTIVVSERTLLLMREKHLMSPAMFEQKRLAEIPVKHISAIALAKDSKTLHPLCFALSFNVAMGTEKGAQEKATLLGKDAQKSNRSSPRPGAANGRVAVQSWLFAAQHPLTMCALHDAIITHNPDLRTTVLTADEYNRI